MNESMKENQVLTQLFYKFMDACLHVRDVEAVDLLAESFTGIVMCAKGFAHSKKEVAEILKNESLSFDAEAVEFKVQNLIINRLCQEAATIFAEIVIDYNPRNSQCIHCELYQSMSVNWKEGKWQIVSVHSSPKMVLSESELATPFSFVEGMATVQKVESKASMDSLTGILNREGFERNTIRLMKDYNPKHNTALFMIDLDDFKQINDRLGHPMGDTVLKQVATVLRNVFRESDAVGRIGGDEFMVLLTGDFSVKFLEQRAEELLNAMHLTIKEGQVLPISISVGITYGRARVTFEKLYRIADVALYTAKKMGKCRYHLVNSDTNAHRDSSGGGANLQSLQALLNDTDSKELISTKTPYETLLENIPGGVIACEFTEKEIKMTHCNDWYARFLNYNEEDVRALQDANILALVHPDDWRLVRKAIETIRSGADCNNIIYRVRHKDGSYRHINQMVSITERRKDSILMQGIISDVEEVMQLQKEVEESKKELELLIANIPGCVVMFEFEEDRIKTTHRNAWFAQLLGYNEEELKLLQEANPLVFVHPDDMDDVIAAAQSIRAGANRNSIVYRVRHKDGSYTHMAQTVTVSSRKPGSIVMYGIETDVEEGYRLKQAVEETKRELEAVRSMY